MSANETSERIALTDDELELIDFAAREIIGSGLTFLIGQVGHENLPRLNRNIALDFIGSAYSIASVACVGTDRVDHFAKEDTDRLCALIKDYIAKVFTAMGMADLVAKVMVEAEEVQA